MSNAKSTLQNVTSKIDWFVQSDIFIALNALLIFIGWAFNIWPIILAILICINVFPLFISKNNKHLFTLIIMFTFIIGDNRHHLEDFSYLLYFIILLFVGMLFSVIRYKRDWSILSIKNIKGFHFSLILLIIPFALAGVTSPYENKYACLIALALIFIYALFYTLFFVSNYQDENKEYFMEYTIKILFMLGIVIVFEIIYYYASKANSKDELLKMLLSKSIDLGWGAKNNVSPCLAMCIPSGLYFCTKKNKALPFFLIISTLEYIIVMMLGSRGTMLFSSVVLLASIVYTFITSKNKKEYSITFAILLVIALIVFLVKREDAIAYFKAIFPNLDSSGRIDGLYPEAIETFKMWPVFGSGWDYKLGQFAHDNYTPYWYHSTFLQVLACMGIVGVIFFTMFYIFRYATYLRKIKEPAAIMLMASLLIFDLYGMTDTNFFGPSFFPMLLVFTIPVELNLKKDEGNFLFLKRSLSKRNK